MSAKTNKNSTRQILQYFWKVTKAYPKQLALSSLLIVQVTINVIVIPLIVSFSVAKLSRPEAFSLSFPQILGLIVILALTSMIFHRISADAIDSFEIEATKDIHNEVAEHLVRETYDFHSKSFSGALQSQAVKLTSSYVMFIDTIFLTGFRSFIIVVFSSIVLSFYDLRLALIIGGLSLFGIFMSGYMASKRFPLQKKAVVANSVQSAYLSDMLTNFMTIKSFGAEDHEIQQFRKITTTAGKAWRVTWHKQLNANSMTLATVALMTLTVLAYGIHATQSGSLQPAVFITAQLYAIRITGSFWDTSSIIRSLERAFSEAHEMVEILSRKPSLVDSPSATAIEVNDGAITFNDVSFHYGDSEQNVIDNFSMTIQPGEKIGLVGRSGGGKTTITKLVLRFLDIQKGVIAIDGQDIANVTQKSLRQSIAYVPQEPLLFHRSIAENIAYGKPGASQDEIIAAAKKAFADEFIVNFPSGYDTLVGERGVKLSGGQRQRIAIARAIIKDAPILLLDEATSALDSESEVLIQKALWKLMEKRTALVIAHRLSTVQKMDRILVIDKGQIIEHGSHSELIARKGTYAELWTHQSGGFIEE